MKKAIPWILVGFLLITSGYFYNSRGNLQANLAQSQSAGQEAREEIEDLKKEIRSFKAEESSETEVLEAPIEDENTPTTLPRIAVEPKVWDFGTIRKKDGIVTARFEVTNTGGSPLVLNRIFTSCGCTASDLDQQTLQPSQHTTVEIKYDPNYLGEYFDLGNIEKKASIISNDPKNLFYRISLKANVKP